MPSSPRTRRTLGRLARVKRGSVLADVVAAASVGAIPLLHFSGLLQFWQLVVLVFLLAGLNGVGDTPRYALVPTLSRMAAWSPEMANGTDRAMVRLGAFLGPVVGGALIAMIGAPRVLLIDCVTFLLSAALVGFAVPPRANQSTDAVPTRKGYFADLLDGLRSINPLYSMTIKDHTPPEMLGRVVATLTALAEAAVPVGAVAAGIAVQRLGLVPTLAGMAVIASVLTFSMFVNRALRAMDSGQLSAKAAQ